MAIGDKEPITCRPADLLKPELDKYAEEIKDVMRSDEDVLTYALFPQVALKFFESRDKKTETPVAAAKAPAAAPAAPAPKASAAPSGVTTLYVEDMSL